MKEYFVDYSLELQNSVNNCIVNNLDVSNHTMSDKDYAKALASVADNAYLQEYDLIAYDCLKDYEQWLCR